MTVILKTKGPIQFSIHVVFRPCNTTMTGPLRWCLLPSCST